MKKICIKSFVKDGLSFHKNEEYHINYNPIDSNIYIYNVYGYTTISKRTLDEYFL